MSPRSELKPRDGREDFEATAFLERMLGIGPVQFPLQHAARTQHGLLLGLPLEAVEDTIC